MSAAKLDVETEGKQDGKCAIGTKWNVKDLEITTRSVERALQPLINQVTSLTTLLSTTKVTSKKKKGRSKRAVELVADLERATKHFVDLGQQMADENGQIAQEMLEAVDGVRKTGAAMSQEARQFASDPASTVKRGNMIRTARSLLTAVARLVTLADMIDVRRLMDMIRAIKEDLDRLENVSSQLELEEAIKSFDENVNDLAALASRRQHQLKGPQLRRELAGARALLKRNADMLMTACKAYIRHPELAASKANRDFVLKRVTKAVNTISDVVEGKRGTDSVQEEQDPYGNSGGFSAALDDLDRRIIMDPLTFNEQRCRPSLEECLERIVSGAALMADSSCTRDDRRDRIVAECNAVRLALQDLLSEYMANAGQKDRSPQLDQAIKHMGRKTQDLRRQLRKAVVDHVSDVFMEPTAPLAAMIEAAGQGDKDQVEQCAQLFSEHGSKLVEVALLACSVCKNQHDQEAVTMVRYVAAQIELLCPQVMNAARILAARPQSKVARQNMENFRTAWMNQLAVLTDAVDDVTTVDDFMAVSENQILEEIKSCVQALQDRDASALDRAACSIRSRTARLTNVVVDEMEKYEKGTYTEKVLDAVKMLNDQLMPNLGKKVELAVEALTTQAGPKEVDENDFIDASCLVYDAVREVRRCVLLNRDDDELDPEEVEIAEPGTPLVDTNAVNQYPNVSDEDRKRMEQQIQSFQSEKHKFDLEVAKWDDSGNDIVSIAKYMCLIMMDMADFTRRRGPLKTTMEVINAAKKITESGSKLDKVARQIADQCPESSTKKDLLTYLGQIDFFTNQLKITSNVKQDVEETMNKSELFMSSLDSAASLIQSAKNLMNAVVMAVKATYVASTKYARKDNASSFPTLIWKMKPPEKKPLIRRERTDDIRAIVRRASTRRQERPIKILSEFHGLADQF